MAGSGEGDRPDDSARATWYGVVSVFKNLAPLVGLYALAPRLADGSLPTAWALTPVIGVLVYRLTMVMHDCGHVSLFPRRRLNIRVGKLLGFVTGIDFARFRDRHWEHHQRYGVAGDPQGFHYLGTEQMSRGRFAWHLLKPLLGQNLKHVVGESYLAPGNLQRSLASGEWIAIVAVQAALAVLITGAGAHPSLALMPLVGAATFGLFLSQLRGIAEHGVRGTGRPPEGFVRSHARDWPGRLPLYDVNFNFHEEHHHSPGVPSRLLPETPGNQREPGGSRPTMWRTLRNMVGAK